MFELAENKRKLLSNIYMVVVKLGFGIDFLCNAADMLTSRNTLPEWFLSGISVDRLCNYLMSKFLFYNKRVKMKKKFLSVCIKEMSNLKYCTNQQKCSVSDTKAL